MAENNKEVVNSKMTNEHKLEIDAKIDPTNIVMRKKSSKDQIDYINKCLMPFINSNEQSIKLKVLNEVAKSLQEVVSYDVTGLPAFVLSSLNEGEDCISVSDLIKCINNYSLNLNGKLTEVIEDDIHPNNNALQENIRYTNEIEINPVEIIEEEDLNKELQDEQIEVQEMLKDDSVNDREEIVFNNKQLNIEKKSINLIEEVFRTKHTEIMYYKD